MIGDFTTVTEVPGSRASREQLAMIRTRYRLGADLSAGRRVLEVACGPGRGLRLLADASKSAVGGDLTWPLVRQAASYYRGAVPVIQFDALALPFAAGSFDVIVLFEALYYLPDAGRFVREAHRVLSPDGALLLCTSNSEWGGFCRSAFSTKHYTTVELRDLLERHGFTADLRGGFSTSAGGTAGRVLAHARRTAARLNLIPQTLTGREWLKRLVFGPLETLGSEVTAKGPVETLRTLNGSTQPVTDFKVLYAIARKTPHGMRPGSVS